MLLKNNILERITCMLRRISSKQAGVVEFVTQNPGCTAADVTRHEWAGRGHTASYARVTRLLRRNLLRRGVSALGRGVGLYTTAA